MVSLVALWLPIVLAAVLVFVVSSILHMVLPLHRSDYSVLPNEAAVRAAMLESPLPPGVYPVPYCADPKQMGSEEMLAKYRQGPVAMINVMPSRPPQMQRFLGQWFVYLLVVSLFAGYLASRTLAPGTDYLEVFRVSATAAFMSYGLGNLVDSIWRGIPWRVTLKATADGFLYALVTGGVFGWLWPA